MSCCAYPGAAASVQTMRSALRLSCTGVRPALACACSRQERSLECALAGQCSVARPRRPHQCTRGPDACPMARARFAGPWKGCWVRCGFDPRLDPAARRLQVLELRVPAEWCAPLGHRRARVGVASLRSALRLQLTPWPWYHRDIV